MSYEQGLGMVQFLIALIILNQIYIFDKKRLKCLHTLDVRCEKIKNDPRMLSKLPDKELKFQICSLICRYYDIFLQTSNTIRIVI